MSSIVRAIHNAGLAIWWGGSLMGITALNPAVEVLDDPEERGKMVDEGWARFQPWGAAGLAAAGIAHIIMRRNPPRRPTQTYKSVARLQDVLVVAAGVSSIASLALGEYSTQFEDDAYTPMEDATTPHEDTPEPAAKAQKGLSVVSWIQLASGLGLIITSAVLVTERERSARGLF